MLGDPKLWARQLEGAAFVDLFVKLVDGVKETELEFGDWE